MGPRAGWRKVATVETVESVRQRGHLLAKARACMDKVIVNVEAIDCGIGLRYSGGYGSRIGAVEDVELGRNELV